MSLDPSASQRQRPGLILILIVEDEPLIGLDLAGTLEEHGFEVLGPALTVAAALQLLESRSPDAAVLDVNLGRERVTPVARWLRGRGVPFVLASSCTPVELGNDELLAAATNLGKPTSPTRLVAELSGLVGRAGGIAAGGEGRP